MAIRKELATELKDLDVDRVDGVDRPATGKPFLLYKSENDDAAQIAAAIRRVSKTADDVYAEIIQQACDRHIMKMFDSHDKPVGFVVKGDDITSPLFKTLDEAVALVTRVIRGEIAEGRRKAGKPPLEDGNSATRVV